MATSGTNNFSLTIADCMDEAFGRIQVDTSKLGAEDLISARRSLDLLFIEWQNQIPMQWKIEEDSVTLAADTTSFTLGADVADVISVIFRDENGKDTPVWPMSRREYHELIDKTQQNSYISRFFLERQSAANILYVYPVLDSATSRTIRIFALKEIEDSGGIRYTPDVAKAWLPALCAGWAWKLSEKYKPELMASKAALAADALAMAMDGDQEYADITFTMCGY